ncbi:MAG: FHA domain-containing protein [Planctomycetaceae bacterium]
MSENPMILFQRSLAAPEKLILKVSRADDGKPKHVELQTPFAVIGRGSGADVLLKGSRISYRHAYIQPLRGSLFCIDLGSKSGLKWGQKRRDSGWLSPSASLSVGPYQIALTEEDFLDAAEDASSGQRENPLERMEQGLDDYPRFELVISQKDSEPRAVPIDRLITLIGRSNSCAVQLADESVSRIHCSLVLTPDGLWVIDLLGKSGVIVGEKQLRSAPLEHGDRLRVGSFSITVNQLTSTDDLYEESEVEENVAAVEEHAETHKTSAAETVRHTEWLGTVFHIEREPETLVVLPNLSPGTFRYTKLHSEANSLRLKLNDPDIRHLIIDFQRMNYIGAEAIGAIIKLARQATDAGGNVAFCRISAEVRMVLNDMGLLRLWPDFKTREEAVSSVRDR